MERANPSSAIQQIPWKWGIYMVVGLLLIWWLVNTPAGLLGKADAVGYAVCHRIDLRSFHLGERQLPLCARCSGMYLGAMLGLAYQAVISRRKAGMPSMKMWVILGILVAAFAVDGINSYLHFFPGLPSLYEPQNWLRLFTGAGMGVVIAAMLYPAFNQTVWMNWENQPALKSFSGIGGLLILAILLDILVLTENPVILYPLALISAGGVLVILTMVHTA